MLHLGDITKINGAEAPVVDCIIGGSPCQDLSIAGKRAGLAGERSGLYMDQIRVIKEMRERDRANGRTGEFIRPRYMVWENVPGAFSSNKGKDFAAVLEEAVRVVEPQAPDVPVPEKGWPTAGVVVGDGWSVAWRVLDAQFWGVPQRRRRIALVADFGGQSAPEVLFVRKGVSGHSEPCGTEGQGFTPGTETGVSYAVRIRGGCDGGGKGALVQEKVSGTLGCNNDQTIFTIDHVITTGGNCTAQGSCVYENIAPTLKSAGTHALMDKPQTAYAIGSYHSNAWKSDNPNSGVYKTDVAKTLDAINCGYPGCNQGGTAILCLNDQGGNIMSVSNDVSATLRAQEHGHQPCVLDMTHANDVIRDCGETVPTLQSRMGTGGNQVPLVYSIGNGQLAQLGLSEKARTLDCMHDQQAIFVSGFDCYNQGVTGDVSKPLTSAATDSDHIPCVHQKRVRRLTPLECERLQGFPDHWTDIGTWVDSKGKKHETSDAARYKALGSSIALPPWKWVLKRLCAQYERDATMASLFDGISGFPLLWEQLNGEGSCVWASEIEEFPMAVTKLRLSPTGQKG